jgi:hypothetical protein
MKSIKQQYIDLMEGRMSQHNFMRSLRMSLPQYITNVTSFKDSVKILKNKGILSEAMDVKDEDEEFIDMIAKAEKDKEEEEAIKSGFGIYDPLEEDDDKDEAPEDYEDPDMFDAYGMDASEGKLREGKKKREPKKELHPNQIHPQELRMGIKVELEHTDDLDKAKKIALDHLAENPFYYTALKLSGIESPSSPKAKYPVAFKKEVIAAVELVDKINAMKPVKGVEKAKASSNKARKETNKLVKGVSELTHNAQSVRGLQKFAATGGKMKTVKSIYEAKFNAMPGEEPNTTVQHAMGFIQSNPVLRQISDLITLQNDGENAILRYDYYKALPDEAYNKLELQFFVEDDFEGSDEDGGDDFETSGGTQSKIAYILYPKKKAGNLGTSLEMGASKASKMDAFKESLEKLVREVLDEMYDGYDNLDRNQY